MELGAKILSPRPMQRTMHMHMRVKLKGQIVPFVTGPYELLLHLPTYFCIRVGVGIAYGHPVPPLHLPRHKVVDLFARKLRQGLLRLKPRDKGQGTRITINIDA